jgi:hypothetical protein
MKNLKLLLMWLWTFIYHTTPQYIIKEVYYKELKFHKYTLYRRDYFLLYIPIYRSVDETDSLIRNTKDYQSWGLKYNIINIITIEK